MNIILSNDDRSACYAALEMWNEAAEDGRMCIITDKNFVKGYFRQALALQNMVLHLEIKSVSRSE